MGKRGPKCAGRQKVTMHLKSTVIAIIKSKRTRVNRSMGKVVEAKFEENQ